MTLLDWVHRVELMSWVNSLCFRTLPMQSAIKWREFMELQRKLFGLQKRKKNFRLGRETFSYQCTRGISAFSTVFHPKLQSRHDYIQFTTFSVSLAYTLVLSSQLLMNIHRFLLCCFTWQNNIILPKSLYQPAAAWSGCT